MVWCWCLLSNLFRWCMIFAFISSLIYLSKVTLMLIWHYFVIMLFLILKLKNLAIFHFNSKQSYIIWLFFNYFYVNMRTTQHKINTRTYIVHNYVYFRKYIMYEVKVPHTWISCFNSKLNLILKLFKKSVKNIFSNFKKLAFKLLYVHQKEKSFQK